MPLVLPVSSSAAAAQPSSKPPCISSRLALLHPIPPSPSPQHRLVRQRPTGTTCASSRSADCSPRPPCPHIPLPSDRSSTLYASLRVAALGLGPTRSRPRNRLRGPALSLSHPPFLDGHRLFPPSSPSQTSSLHHRAAMMPVTMRKLHEAEDEVKPPPIAIGASRDHQPQASNAAHSPTQTPFAADRAPSSNPSTPAPLPVHPSYNQPTSPSAAASLPPIASTLYPRDPPPAATKYYDPTSDHAYPPPARSESRYKGHYQVRWSTVCQAPRMNAPLTPRMSDSGTLQLRRRATKRELLPLTSSRYLPSATRTSTTSIIIPSATPD